MSRNEIRARADQYRKDAARAATESDRNVLLRKAARYYEDAGYPGLAKFCERLTTQ